MVPRHAGYARALMAGIARGNSKRSRQQDRNHDHPPLRRAECASGRPQEPNSSLLRGSSRAAGRTVVTRARITISPSLNQERLLLSYAAVETIPAHRQRARARGRLPSPPRGPKTKSPGAKAEACDPARVHPANQSSRKKLATNFERMMTRLRRDDVAWPEPDRRRSLIGRSGNPPPPRTQISARSSRSAHGHGGGPA